MPISYSEKTKNAARDLYVSGHNFSEISNLLKIKSTSTIANWAKEDKDSQLDWDKKKSFNDTIYSGAISPEQQYQFIKYQWHKIQEEFTEKIIDSKSVDVLSKLNKIMKDMSSADQMIRDLDVLKRFSQYLHENGQSDLSKGNSKFIQEFVYESYRTMMQR
jgi:hypothetical protein